MELLGILWKLLLVVATLSSIASGQGWFGVEEMQGSSSQVIELAPQHQVTSDIFESVSERFSSCDPSSDKSCQQNQLPVCGSDGETYSDEEELLKAMKVEPRLRQAHEGMCLGLESQFGLDESSLMSQGLESIRLASFGQRAAF